jgi:hypothetical protein
MPQYSPTVVIWDQTASTATVGTIWTTSFQTYLTGNSATTSLEVYNLWNEVYNACEPAQQVALHPALARAAEVAAAAHVAQEAARKSANGRAKALLLANLTPEQRRTFDDQGYFDVDKSPLGYFYRVFLGRSANVIQYHRPLHGRPVPAIALCCHPSSYVPDEDTVLAQKFMLEYDEAQFLKLANRHDLESAYARHYLARPAA